VRIVNTLSALAAAGTTGVDPAAVDPFVVLTWSILGFLWYVLVVIAYWQTFSKAGYPGWLSIIPIVNWFVLVKIGGYSAWWGLLALVPLVNIVFAIVLALRIGRAFGHGGAFSFFLLFLLNPIGYFVKGFSSDTYTRPAAV